MSAGNARRRGLRAQSSKQRSRYRRRRLMLRREHTRPICSVPWCARPADDAHEILTRARAGAIDDENNVAPLCRPHHDEITRTEPQWAYEEGLLRHSWDGPRYAEPPAELCEFVSYVMPSVAVTSDTMSPRPPSDRQPITVRLSQQGIRAIDERAQTAGVDRSEMIRQLLSYAAQHMPAARRPVGAREE